MASQYSPATQSNPLTVGQWLRKARLHKGMALRQIASILGIDQSHLGKYERDDRVLTLSQAASFAAAYQVSVAELKQRIVTRQVIEACEGDTDLAEAALGRVGEDAPAYRVNNPANNPASTALVQPSPGQM